MKMEVKSVSISEEYGAVIVGFMDEMVPSQYVLLQRTLDPDAQDQELGHDKLYVEVNDESRSGYCDVEEAVLNHNRLSLRFNQKTARGMGIDNTIEIQWPSSDEQLIAIEVACRKLFDQHCFKVV